MRFSEMAMSIPSILIIIFLQAILGQANILSISLVIGLTSWMSIAKVVRTEVHQIKSSEYIQYARLTGGRFFYILRRHLLPNFIPSIMFMVVTNISSAIGTESTLSFLGLAAGGNRFLGQHAQHGGPCPIIQQLVADHHSRVVFGNHPSLHYQHRPLYP